MFFIFSETALFSAEYVWDFNPGSYLLSFQRIVKHKKKLSTLSWQDFVIKAKTQVWGTLVFTLQHFNSAFFLKFVFSHSKKMWKCLIFLFSPKFRHVFHIRPFIGHKLKFVKWIIYHHNKNLNTRILWNLHGKFSLIVTKFWKIELQPLQSKFLSIIQS